MSKQISCDLQDYFEVACIYHYQLAIELTDGSKHSGKAITLKTISKVEYLVVENDQTQQVINLTEIKMLDVLTSNAKFKSIKI